MVWKDCGYFTVTKKGTAVSVVIKHVRYHLKLEEVKAVLEGKQRYTLVFEPPAKGEPTV